MLKSVMKKYAKLIVRVGANVQKGQYVLVYAAVDQHKFAEMVVDEAYKAGAKNVRVEWRDQAVTKLNYRHQSVSALSEVLPAGGEIQVDVRGATGQDSYIFRRSRRA